MLLMSRARTIPSVNAGYGPNRIKRISEIFNQVFCRFDANRYSDQSISDPEFLPVLSTHSRVRGGRWSSEQTFDSAKAHRNDRYRDVFHELFCRGLATFGFEAEHAAEPVKQLSSPVVLWMARESWIVDLRNAVMFLQESRDFEGALIVLFHAQGQCLHSSVQQKTGVRVQASPKMIQSKLDLAD